MILRPKFRKNALVYPLRTPMFTLVACIVSMHAITAHGARDPLVEPTTQETTRMTELRDRLCASRFLECDPRLTIYEPPAPTPEPTTPLGRAPKANPYLTARFGLLANDSLERCRSFIASHTRAFNAAQAVYGVTREVICGHLRIETDFGIATPLSPHPLGTFPAIDRLISLYVRAPAQGSLAHFQRRQAANEHSLVRFQRRQRFALEELTDLIEAAKVNDWDLFEIPGSPTGAIGLVQFEPSAFDVAVDGNGDGKIDLFDPDDAIFSVAHYLVTRGWDANPDHQKRAIYAYYGGHYNKDPDKYYMKAVLAYADAVRTYLAEHPI